MNKDFNRAPVERTVRLGRLLMMVFLLVFFLFVAIAYSYCLSNLFINARKIALYRENLKRQLDNL